MRKSWTLFVWGACSSLIAIASMKGIEKWEKKSIKQSLQIAKKAPVVTEEKPFVIVVPSYNNQAFYEKNLRSIEEQKYQNFRVIYINDASTDKTGPLVRRYLETSPLKERVSFIDNPQNLGALANLYFAIHSCRSDEIVTILDGDDWFAHADVLSDLNAYFANPDVWITYGDHLTYPDYKKGESFPVVRGILEKGHARSAPWAFSHLRTFYAGLFQRIALEHLMYQGAFFPTTYDLAVMFPMIEMAREHTFFIPKVHYIYNFANPINDCKNKLSKQQFFDQWIRKLPVYPALKEHPATSMNGDTSMDMVLFSVGDPEAARRAIDILPCGSLTLLYSEKCEGQYEEVKAAFPNVQWISEKSVQTLPTILEKSKAKYVLFGQDRLVQDAPFEKILGAMNQTHAKIFLFHARDDLMGLPIAKGIVAFQFPHQAHLPQIDLAIYRKEPLMEMHRRGQMFNGALGLAYSLASISADGQNDEELEAL